MKTGFSKTKFSETPGTAKLLNESEFEYNQIRGLTELDTKEYALQVASVEKLAENIYQANLLATAGTIPEYFAGQYLQLLIPDQESAFFSIANAPGERHIQLHLEVQPVHARAVAILNYIRQNSVVKALLPMGNCYLAAPPAAEVVLIATGTGFSQSKAIAEFLFEQAFAKQVSLYWGVRHESEMYARQLAEQWSRRHANWRFVPVFADNSDNEWPGHHDELVKAGLTGGHQWQTAEVYVSGSPPMVYTAMDALIPAGLKATRFFSDVLEYAPRESG